MNLRFNLPRVAWAAAVLFFVVLVLPQGILAGKNYSLNGSFHVGSTYPLSYLDDTSDSNIHFRFDLSFRYQLADKLALAAVGFYGFNQFTEDEMFDDNLYWRNISVNAKVIWNVTSDYYIYLQAGPGSYKAKANFVNTTADYVVGHTASGYNVGGGFQVKMSGSSRLEFGVDYHRFNAPTNSEEEIKIEFLTLQLGVIFPLF